MNFFIRNERGTCWHRNASSHNLLWVNIPPRLGFWTIYKAVLMYYMGERGWDFHKESKIKKSERQRKTIGSFSPVKDHCPGKFCPRGKLETTLVSESPRKSFATYIAPEEIAFWTKRNVTGRWYDSSKVWLSKSCWVQPCWQDRNEDTTEWTTMGEKIRKLWGCSPVRRSGPQLNIPCPNIHSDLGLSQTDFKSQYGPSQLLERNGTKVVRGSQKPGDWEHWESKDVEVQGSEKTSPASAWENKELCFNPRYKGFARTVQYSNSG